MIGITTNFQSTIPQKPLSTNIKNISFAQQPCCDTFENKTKTQNISFSGKMIDYLSGRFRLSKKLEKLTKKAEKGDIMAKNQAVEILTGNSYLTYISQIKAIKMLEEFGSKKDMLKLFEHVACSGDRDEGIQVMAILAIPKIADKIAINKQTLQKIHDDLEPISYVTDDLDQAAQIARQQLKELIK